MASDLAELFQKRGLPVVIACLQSVAGRSADVVVRDELFQKHLLNPAWAGLSVPLRMVGRARLHWDELFEVLRREAFDLSQGKLTLRKDLGPYLATLVKRLFGEEAPAPATAALPTLAEPVPSPPRTTASLTLALPPLAVEGASPSQATHAVGIDLGTTYSVVAHIDSHGRPISIPNTVGDILTPSVVLFDEAGPIVGKEALLAAPLEPDRVAECAKRDMGSRAYRKTINGESIPPEVISSLVLRSLKADAERKLGPVTQAVITVPAYFDETRRRATMDAGKLAGLEVLDLINEPTAAAIAYGYELGFLDGSCKPTGGQPLRLLVYDLGGGTFDVTIVEIDGNAFKAVATDGDVYLGGKDWDEKLIEIAAERFRQKHGQDPRTNPMSLQELSLAVEVAKKTLSERPRAMLVVNHLGTRLRLEITREEFEEATAALLGRTRTTTEIVVRQAGLTMADIHRFLVVGGSTRMPMVQHMLMELTGRPPDRSVSADEAVAHGAALYAELLLRERRTEQPAPSFTVQNVNSHSLGVVGTNPKTGDRSNRILIPKNTQLPHTVSKLFRTLRPDQHSVAVRILEGECKHPEECTQVGLCVIRDLPPGLPKGWPVKVKYSYEANGRLRVSASLKGHKARVSTEFVRNNSLPDDDLSLWAEYVAGQGERAT